MHPSSVMTVAVILYDADGTAPLGRVNPLELLASLNLANEALEVDLGLDRGAVGSRGPVPDVAPLDIGAGGEEGAETKEVPAAAGEVQGRVAFDVGPLHSLVGAGGGVGEQQLQDGVVAAYAGLHDGVAAADVAPEDAGPVGFAEQVDDVGVSGPGGQHEGRLVVFVEGRARDLVARAEQGFANVSVAQRRGKMQVRVGEAHGRGVRVVEERGVRLEEAPDEEGIPDVDGPSQANRGLNPVEKVSVMADGSEMGGSTDMAGDGSWLKRRE